MAVTPMLTYEDAAASIAWLSTAFGFVEDATQRYDNPDGSIGHAEMETGSGPIMIASGSNGYQSPRHHREECAAAERWSQVPWVFNGVQVTVKDVEAHYARARDFGARLLSGIEDQEYGRFYRAEDLEGHRWMFIQSAGS
jgi:uncharacterized glyoxalase superfamily protein PhnB